MHSHRPLRGSDAHTGLAGLGQAMTRDDTAFDTEQTGGMPVCASGVLFVGTASSPKSRLCHQPPSSLCFTALCAVHMPNMHFNIRAALTQAFRFLDAPRRPGKKLKATGSDESLDA